jgi:hypothetical protein
MEMLEKDPLWLTLVRFPSRCGLPLYSAIFPLKKGFVTPRVAQNSVGDGGWLYRSQEKKVREHRA